MATTKTATSMIKDLSESVFLILLSRIMQLIGIPAGLFFAGWLFTSINEMSISITQLKTQMEERTSDRYTATDAKHDFAVTGVQIEGLDRRIGVLEEHEFARRRSTPPPETQSRNP